MGIFIEILKKKNNAVLCFVHPAIQSYVGRKVVSKHLSPSYSEYSEKEKKEKHDLK